MHHCDAFAPDAVIPFVFPQQLLQAQYADVLNVLTFGVIPSTFLASDAVEVVAGFVLAVTKVEPLLDVICFVLISITLLTAFFITFDDISILSISLSF